MAKLPQLHILAVLAFIFFGSVVQAQWQWGNTGGQQFGGQNPGAAQPLDDDDEEGANQANQWGGNAGGNRNQPKNQPRPQQPQQQPWNAPWGNQPQQQPWQQQQQQQPYQQPWQQPQQPWQQQQPRPPQQPQQNAPPPWFSQQPQQPWQQQPGRPPVPSQTWGGQQGPQQPPRATPPPNNPPVVANPSSSRTKTWSQPSQWGPSRSPFGPSATAAGPQTIPTTTTEAPREPVPYLTTCGRTRYVEYDVSNALINGCYYKNKTKTVGKSEFPKPFQNLYGFNFGDTRPPFWEYPLIDSAAYIGGPPGPDRVIFNDACHLAGEITQTNAGTRQWTECSETY